MQTTKQQKEEDQSYECVRARKPNDSDIFNTQKHTERLNPVRCTPTYYHTELSPERDDFKSKQREVLAVKDSNIFKQNRDSQSPYRLRTSQTYQSNLPIDHNFDQINNFDSPSKLRNSKTFKSKIPIDHPISDYNKPAKKQVQTSIITLPDEQQKMSKEQFKPKFEDKLSPQKQRVQFLHGEKGVEILENLEAQQVIKKQIQQRPQSAALKPQDMKYKELHSGGIQEKDFSYQSQKSDLRQVQNHHNAMWWESAKQPQQVNENANFDRNFAQQFKIQSNNSNIFQTERSQVEYQKIKTNQYRKGQYIVDNTNEDNRKKNHNYSDLFDNAQKLTSHQPIRVIKQNKYLKGELMPSNLTFNQYDSKKHAKDYGQATQQRDNCTQRYHDNLKSVLDSHNYEAEFHKGKRLNQPETQKTETLNDQLSKKIEVKQQKVEEKQPERIAIFRQKLDKEKQDMKTYNLDIKGLNQKFDVKLFKKQLGKLGYVLQNFKIDMNSVKKPTGRGQFVIRNAQSAPENFEKVKQLMSSNGLLIIKEKPQNEEKSAVSSKSVKLGSQSNLAQEI